MRRRTVAWAAGGLLVLLGVCVFVAMRAPRESVPLHFWVRVQAAGAPALTGSLHRAPDGDEIGGWTVSGTIAQPTVRVPLLTAWRNVDPISRLLRDLGLRSRARDHIVAAQLPDRGPPGWIECLTTNAAWPDDAEPDPSLVGTWETTAGGACVACYDLLADGTVRPAQMGASRWARVGDVVIFGMWHPGEARWQMCGSILLDDAAETYVGFGGATGRRVR